MSENVTTVTIGDGGTFHYSSGTVTTIDHHLCLAQEKVYSAGWRDYAAGRDRTGQVVLDMQRFYRMGWADHERRDQRQAMYARREKP